MRTFYFVLTLCLLSLISAESSQNSVARRILENGTYVRTIGRCATIGCEIITTESECSIAASHLDLPSVTLTHTTHNRLAGCFVYRTSKTEFNYNLQSTNDWVDTDALCYCPEDPNKACESSQEWTKVCENCRCELPPYDVTLNMDIDTCKSYAEIHGYDHISIKDNECHPTYEVWCSDTDQPSSGWDTHKLTVEECPKFGNTTVWSNMKGFDSVCSKSEYSIEIRVDQTFYARHDDDYVRQDCNTLCGSVGSVCFAAWEDCPVAGETTNNFGCNNTNSDTFVCSCAAIPRSGFFLMDGAPGSGREWPEISNPNMDLYQDLGEVQCCNVAGRCTRNSNGDCMSGNSDAVKYSLFEAISMCEALGDDWSLCTREEINSGICTSKGCNHDSQYVWAWDPNAILASSKVINYDECTAINSVTGPENEFDPEKWGTKCPENTAIVSVETKDLEPHNHYWSITKIQCCALVDKITESQYRIPEGQNYLKGGGSSSVEDEWEAQCPPNAVMVGIYNDDDSGDFDDIDAAKCNALECPYTCGAKMDNDDCVVVNLSPASLSSCPIDYVMVGLWDSHVTEFNRVRKMKCCRVLESILPTVSPTQMPTTDDPSECPTVSPTTSIPSMSPTTNDPTMAPSTDTPTKSPSQNPTTEEPSAFPTQNPTTEQPTYAPSLSPSTEEPSISPSWRPTVSDPTYYPSNLPSKNPTTDSPTVSPTISPSTNQPTRFPSTSPSTDEPTAFPTTEEPSLFPTMAPSTDSPTKSPSQNPTTDDPTAFPTTEEPTLFPTLPPSTDSPTKFPTRNPTTDDPTAFPSTPPTYAPTLCEPTCRSHTDQLVHVFGRLLDFNTQLLRDFEPSHPLKNVLNEMILDLERLKDQMNIAHDKVIPIIPPVH